jgi:hypothetical protein
MKTSLAGKRTRRDIKYLKKEIRSPPPAPKDIKSLCAMTENFG